MVFGLRAGEMSAVTASSLYSIWRQMTTDIDQSRPMSTLVD